MDRDDPAAADPLRARRAEVLPILPWWFYPTSCLQFALLGSIQDLPQAWKAAPALMVVTVALLILPAVARSQARLPSIRLGRRDSLVVWSVVVAAFAAALGLALTLQALGALLPFTLSGLLLGIGACLLAPRFLRWQASRPAQAPPPPERS